ncbi:polymer-forming cytoskeletal protein [Candidatus Parcubacteria bacterium]|jgi:cytoskeletal protein CcmA (bactofilin family)|nr:polymer-forming cytoskeletal protein [Candidatus Parcubacteria bacterium]
MFKKDQSVTHNSKTIETIIGPSVRVEGDFKGEGDLVIEGILVGTLQTKNNLKIGQNAMVEANIKANNAFISGKIKGNIIAKGKVEITGTAVILGDIKAQIISIESGALLQGNLNMPVGSIMENPTLEKRELEPVDTKEDSDK